MADPLRTVSSWPWRRSSTRCWTHRWPSAVWAPVGEGKPTPDLPRTSPRRGPMMTSRVYLHFMSELEMGLAPQSFACVTQGSVRCGYSLGAQLSHCLAVGATLTQSTEGHADIMGVFQETVNAHACAPTLHCRVVQLSTGDSLGGSALSVNSGRPVCR